MITIWICTFVALLTLAIAAIMRGDFTGPTQQESIAYGLRQVDVIALSNLLDPSEDRFLRSALSHRQFQRVQRMRNRALIQYVAAIAFNAALVIRWTQLARSASPTPVTENVAHDIVNLAVEVRLYAIIALCVLWISLVFPSLRPDRLLPLQRYGSLKRILTESATLADGAVQVAAHL